MSRLGDSHGLFAGRINQTTSPERTPSVAAKPVVTELANEFWALKLGGMLKNGTLDEFRYLSVR